MTHVEVTTPVKKIEKIHIIVLMDRRMKESDIAETVGISMKRVHSILHKHLCMTKLCCRWLQQLLTLDQDQRPNDVSNCTRPIQ